jgi:chaperonin cofactor prefoldin
MSKAADRIRAFMDARAQQTNVSDVYLEIWVANERFVLDKGVLEELLHDTHAAVADLEHFRAQTSKQLEAVEADLTIAAEATNLVLFKRMKLRLDDKEAEVRRYVETILAVYEKLDIKQADVEGTALVSDTVQSYVEGVVTKLETYKARLKECEKERAHDISALTHLQGQVKSALAERDKFSMVLREAHECGMIPVSSTTEGGASKYARQLEVADSIRALLGAPLPPDFAYVQRERLVRLVDEAISRGRDSRSLHPREAQNMVDEFFGKEPA